MNDLDLCLEVVSRSRQPLRYIWRWIYRKPLEIEAWFQRTNNRKWHVGLRLSNGHVTDDVTWPWKVKLMTPKRLERNISKTTWARDFKFGMRLCIGNAEQARCLGHVTPTIFGIWSNISLKLFELETSNLIYGFVWAMPSSRTNKFPWKWACPRSHDPYNFW